MDRNYVDGKFVRQEIDEPTCRCHQNPFIGALRFQEPVILGEPQIMKVN